MSRSSLSRLLCFILLCLILLWRMIGAPISATDWQNVETSLWQARVLLPSRMGRITLLWPLSGSILQDSEASPTLWEDGATPEDAILKQLVQKTDPSVAQMELAVFDTQQNSLVSVPLESYVCAVVAAEMPASYHEEALKAQAVAARTRAVSQSSVGQGCGCSLHEGADICTDSAHCQAFATVQDCLDKWGDEYEVYKARIEQAVAATAGEIITYEGLPITVFYHAISGGVTEDSQTVFAQSLPYLTSVESSGEETVRGYNVDTTFTFAEAASLLQKAFPDQEISSTEVQQNLSIRSYTPTGRVDTLSIGDSEIKAADVRKALGLRSTWFTISADQDTITFHQRGYGHGVGMSQVGANSMAANNANYQTILTHYFQGTAIEALKP